MFSAFASSAPSEAQERSGVDRIGALVAAMVAALFAWWGWKQGAFFGDVFYPGAMLVFTLVAMMLLWAPFEGRLRGPALVALAALSSLAAWSLLSSLWSPTPATAVADAWRVFLYAGVFVLGLWTANLLRRRVVLALVPVAVAIALVGIATVVVLATGVDTTWYLHGDATVRFPIGYRNATATFWMIGIWALLPLVMRSEWRWELRALLAGAGTVLIELMLLAQSRASMPAIALAGVTFLMLSRDRLRASLAIALIALPALPALPTLLDVYHYGESGPEIVPLLRNATHAISLTMVLSLAVSAVAFGVVGRRLRLTQRAESAIGWTLGIVAALAVLGGGALFVDRYGGPVSFADQRIAEFTRVGYPDLSAQGIRYGANVGSNRHDFWRVATNQGLERPLLGGGGGSFEVAYLEHRRSEETPQDPHSVEALMISELGIPGLLLLAVFLAAAAIAALRSRRSGPGAAALVAGGLAAGVQWLSQTSVDWTWAFVGVTAPAIFLLGCAAAPALFDSGAKLRPRLRTAGVVALVPLMVVAVPLFLSDRYLDRGRDAAASEPRAAIAELRRAGDLNPLAAEPLLVEAQVRKSLGEAEEALATLRKAVEREPQSYPARLALARELVDSDPPGARRELGVALELNPMNPAARALARQLDGATAAP